MKILIITWRENVCRAQNIQFRPKSWSLNFFANALQHAMLHLVYNVCDNVIFIPLKVQEATKLDIVAVA